MTAALTVHLGSDHGNLYFGLAAESRAPLRSYAMKVGGK